MKRSLLYTYSGFNYSSLGFCLKVSHNLSWRSTPDRHRGLPQHSDPTDPALLQRLHSQEDIIDSSSPSSYQPSAQRIGDFNAGPTNQKGVVRHRPPARPLILDRNRTHVSSIPLQREEANMTPIGGHGSSSASPLSVPRLLVDNGVSSPHERGRLGQKTAEVNRRRARSLGLGRNRSSSRERSHLQPDNKPQVITLLDLYPVHCKFISGKKWQRSLLKRWGINATSPLYWLTQV